MRLEENPFYILGASIYDDKNKIQELAEDKSFFDDEDSGDIYERAATALTNPKKRIAAEMRWFIGCDSAQEKEIVERFDDHFYYAKKYPSILAEMNFNIYALSYQNLDAETILLIGALYDKLDLAEIKNLLNTAREISGFPPIRDVAEIKSELKNIRDEIRRTIHANIKKFTLSEYLKMAEELVYYRVTGGVVEDFFSKIYSVDMSPRLDEYESKLVGVLKSLEDNPSEDNFKTLEGLLNILTEILKPLHAMSKLTDTVKDEHSEEIFSAVRRLAKYLRNEKDLINEPIRVIKILSLKFNYVDSLKKIADEDIKILEQIQQDYLQLGKVTESGKKILELVESIRRNPSLALINSLTKELNIFIDSTNDLDDIEDLREAMFNGIRNMAIDLHNEKGLIIEPLQILKTLMKCFGRIPKVKSRLNKDIKILEKKKNK